MSLRKIVASKGFTLIELMIVVAIIGILAAVAIPKFADLVCKSKEASTKGNLGALRSALSIYYGDTEGIYPANLFVALTTANKYMPAISQAPSLGRFQIPKCGGAPGHTGPMYDSVSDASGVIQFTSAALITAGDGFPLMYLTGDGETFVYCSHGDSKGTIWSSH